MTAYYHDDLVTLHHGDCIEVMSQFADSSFDLVFTSPPYNLGGFSGGWKPELAEGYAEHGDDMPYPDYVEWQHKVLRECWRLIKPTGAIYYQHKSLIRGGVLRMPFELIPDGLPLRQVVIWDRARGMNVSNTHYLPVHELIVIIAGPEFRLLDKAASGATDIWRHAPVRNSPHPAPFPVQLPAKAIATTGARSILDPFAGSGSTLRAASDAGIRSVGIELTDTYCAQAVARLSQQAFDFTDLEEATG